MFVKAAGRDKRTLTSERAHADLPNRLVACRRHGTVHDIVDGALSWSRLAKTNGVGSQWRMFWPIGHKIWARVMKISIHHCRSFFSSAPGHLVGHRPLAVAESLRDVVEGLTTAVGVDAVLLLAGGEASAEVPATRQMDQEGTERRRASLAGWNGAIGLREEAKSGGFQTGLVEVAKTGEELLLRCLRALGVAADDGVQLAIVPVGLHSSGLSLRDAKVS